VLASITCCALERESIGPVYCISAFINVDFKIYINAFRLIITVSIKIPDFSITVCCQSSKSCNGVEVAVVLQRTEGTTPDCPASIP